MGGTIFYFVSIRILFDEIFAKKYDNLDVKRNDIVECLEKIQKKYYKISAAIFVVYAIIGGVLTYVTREYSYVESEYVFFTDKLHLCIYLAIITIFIIMLEVSPFKSCKIKKTIEYLKR